MLLDIFLSHLCTPPLIMVCCSFQDILVWAMILLTMVIRNFVKYITDSVRFVFFVDSCGKEYFF